MEKQPTAITIQSTTDTPKSLNLADPRPRAIVTHVLEARVLPEVWSQCLYKWSSQWKSCGTWQVRQVNTCVWHRHHVRPIKHRPWMGPTNLPRAEDVYPFKSCLLLNLLRIPCVIYNVRVLLLFLHTMVVESPGTPERAMLSMFITFGSGFCNPQLTMMISISLLWFAALSINQYPIILANQPVIPLDNSCMVSISHYTC